MNNYFPLYYNTTHQKIKINPDKIWVQQVPVNIMVELQKKCSKAIWRPAPGRKLGFLVRHKDKIIGLIFLASPVINLSVRDKYLNLSKDPAIRGKELRNYYDMSVCVGIQPLAWYWNIGKLCALIAPTLGDFINNRYPNDEFKGIITTSLWGKSVQYDRIYKFLGYTKGYGHFQISDDKYKEMINWLKKHNIEVPSSKFGAGSNSRMRRISAYIKYSGDKSVSIKHGQKRGVYYHEAIQSSERKNIIKFWYERWGLPRYNRVKNKKPPYYNGLE